MRNPVEEMKANIHGLPKFPFEQFLMSIHAEDYHGTDDDMCDDFDSWVAELDVEDVMKYAEQALRMALNITEKKNDCPLKGRMGQCIDKECTHTKI